MISWDITPQDTYGLFECRGDMQQVQSKNERYYYFYIENWQPPAQLFLMERGLRHARQLAKIKAPQEMVNQCLAEQGAGCKDQNFAINTALAKWLELHILNNENPSLVTSLVKQQSTFLSCTSLPARPINVDLKPQITLRNEPSVVLEDQIQSIVMSHNFYEKHYNQNGSFKSYLVDNNDQLTVTDMVTGLMWQRQGTDLLSYRKLIKELNLLNQKQFGGFSDWRLPTIDEALSLLIPDKNAHSMHITDCFDPKQGYIHTADRRRPGGRWFVDLNQAHVYWAAGTCFSGGFGRLCRCDFKN